MSFLSVNGISVSYGPLRALWEVSLQISSGERVGLLGANGAGKSTILNTIIGCNKVMSGQIQFNGRDVTNSSPADRVAGGISLVPEGRRLFSEMTVRENLELGAYLARPRANLSSSLEQMFELFPVLREKSSQAAGTLSGGQQQMVAIGRALMSQPSLIMLDEPFIGVAPIVVDEVMGALQKIAGQGITVILVEQNTQRALQFVDRAYVIENGRVVAAGRREELLEDKEFGNKFLGLN